MSAEESRKVVSRAVMDEEFRNTLFSNPDKALAGYELTPEEVSALRSIPAETIDEFANNLDERISMSLLGFGEFAMGDGVYGEMTMGDQVSGDVATGDLVAGDVATGDLVAGDVATGDFVGGEVVSGEVVSGEVVAGDVAAGDAAASAGRSWVARLAGALGFGAGGDQKVY